MPLKSQNGSYRGRFWPLKSLTHRWVWLGHFAPEKCTYMIRFRKVPCLWIRAPEMDQDNLTFSLPLWLLFAFSSNSSENGFSSLMPVMQPGEQSR